MDTDLAFFLLGVICMSGLSVILWVLFFAGWGPLRVGDDK